jgi:hypothetical protein
MKYHFFVLGTEKLLDAEKLPDAEGLYAKCGQTRRLSG